MLKGGFTLGLPEIVLLELFAAVKLNRQGRFLPEHVVLVRSVPVQTFIHELHVEPPENLG